MTFKNGLEEVLSFCEGRESFDSSAYPYLRQLNFPSDIPKYWVWWNNFTIDPDLANWDQDMVCIVLGNGLFVDSGQYYGMGTPEEPWLFRTVVVQQELRDGEQEIDDGYGWAFPLEIRDTDDPDQCLKDIHELVEKWSKLSPPFPKNTKGWDYEQ